MGGMKYRKLRIAWSVAWGLLAVLLITMWIRSYWWCDFVRGPLYQLRQGGITSASGRLMVHHGSKGSLRPPQQVWLLKTISNAEKLWRESVVKQKVVPEYFIVSYHYFVSPYWIVCVFVVAFTVLPWSRSIVNVRQFSLRTLLIVTTLVAVVLGLIVWAVR